jgi:hypothetical protein
MASPTARLASNVSWRSGDIFRFLSRGAVTTWAVLHTVIRARHEKITSICAIAGAGNNRELDNTGRSAGLNPKKGI